MERNYKWEASITCSMSKSICSPSLLVSLPITRLSSSERLEKRRARAATLVLILVFSSRGGVGAGGKPPGQKLSWYDKIITRLNWESSYRQKYLQSRLTLNNKDLPWCYWDIQRQHRQRWDWQSSPQSSCWLCPRTWSWQSAWARWSSGAATKCSCQPSQTPGK